MQPVTRTTVRSILARFLACSASNRRVGVTPGVRDAGKAGGGLKRRLSVTKSPFLSLHQAIQLGGAFPADTRAPAGCSPAAEPPSGTPAWRTFLPGANEKFRACTKVECMLGCDQPVVTAMLMAVWPLATPPLPADPDVTLDRPRAPRAGPAASLLPPPISKMTVLRFLGHLAPDTPLFATRFARTAATAADCAPHRRSARC